ncbi:general substrate transporter [Emericellopsis atlantica]|uniref:General substrate transporter n=1 Tax=Emericellopsis atlantica TaxID=2614577 RepID=A0A9P7ZTT4_9HYPO|nr:general substrate transporter [Emericellopsis atlantica]KAG9258174.1 general substrate transporter [Emericellopsis atlantica]
MAVKERLYPVQRIESLPDDDGKYLDTVIVDGNEAFEEAFLKEPPRRFASGQLWLFAFSAIGFLCSTMNGYDGSLINNLLQNPWFKEKYGVQNDGLWAGIVSSMYQIGGIVALPFVSPCVDGFGRRVGMLIGAGLVVVGTVIQGFSHAPPQFMGGRFLLGFGVAIASAAGPMYVIEINHPAYRGVLGAMYNTLWFSGSIMAAGASRGALNTGGDYSWRLITWLQALFSGIIVLSCMWMPESPRWLYVNNKKDKAREILTRYHGHGDPRSPWVALQLHEYQELLNMDGADKRWWDYRVLFNTGAARYRLLCSISMSIFGQWAGNSVLSYFLSSVLDTAGYENEIEQANITLINNCQQFAFAILGATLVDRIGRRPLLLFSFSACTIVWLGMTIASSQFQASYMGDDADGKALYGNHAASKAALAMIFVFGAVYSVGITPLQALYPCEVLSFEMRAKGMAFSNLAVNAAGMLNQYAWPVSMDKIGWKTYIVFTIWDAVQVMVVYLLLPETKGRTLEELDEIFEADRPVKMSTARKELAFTRAGDVIEIKGV